MARRTPRTDPAGRTGRRGETGIFRPAEMRLKPRSRICVAFAVALEIVLQVALQDIGQLTYIEPRLLFLVLLRAADVLVQPGSAATGP